MEGQGNERHDAALPPVVGPHDEGDVLQGHHDDEGPEEQGEAAQDVGLGQGNGVVSSKNFFHGVQRASPDVAIDHAQGGQGQGGQARLGGLNGIVHANSRKR